MNFFLSLQYNRNKKSILWLFSRFFAIFEGRHGAKGAWERAAEGAAHNFREGCALYNNVWRAYVSHPL